MKNLERQDFENLPFEKQLKYVNERNDMTLEEIARTIGIPQSSLSGIFAKRGYRRERSTGQYVKSEENPPSKKTTSLFSSKDLQELLRYKNQLIALALEKQQNQLNRIDFSFLTKFENQNKKTIAFDLPEELANDFNAVVTKTGYKKQAILTFLIYDFLQKNKKNRTT